MRCLRVCCCSLKFFKFGSGYIFWFAIMNIDLCDIASIVKYHLCSPHSSQSTMNGFSAGEEDSRGPAEQVCCLVDDGFRCHRPAGNASYSKRIQKTVTQRRLKLHLDLVARHVYICDYHKSVIQSARSKRKRRDSEDDSNETDTDIPDVDFYQLQVQTLRRYKKFYKVTTRPSLNKAQLAETLLKHFKTIPVNEKEALSYFIYAVKSNNGCKSDQKSSSDNT